MRLLDLFCGAGGAAVGYHRAGFDEIVGVDTAFQKRYPFEFVQGDALEYVAEYGHEFDLIHASPPCQAFTTINVWKRDYPDLIAETRELLAAAGRPYAIENVPGAPLINPVVLCGAMFDLKVYRHRHFEVSPWLLMPPHIPHRDNTPGAGRGLSDKGFISIAGHMNNVEYCKIAMDIDWMVGSELSQAIPPAYTQYIGRQILPAIVAADKAAVT